MGTRDPRRRLRGEEVSEEEERSSGSERGGLGIRNDIYAAQAPLPVESVRIDVSYHQPEAAPHQPQPEEKEVKFADTDAFSKMPDSTVVDVEEELEAKEGKVSTNYRCTFCPSPGIIPLTEKITHQVCSMLTFFTIQICLLLNTGSSCKLLFLLCCLRWSPNFSRF